MRMPEMTGLELHRHLLGSKHAIPTILMSAYPDERARAQRRESTQSNTVAENAGIFSAFVPENDGSHNGGDHASRANHRDASASQR